MKTILIFAFVLLTCTVNAQDTNKTKIKGSVVSDNKEILKDAVITIYSSDKSIQKKVTANADGQFSFTGLPSEHRYICTASHEDYQDVTLKNFQFEEGKALHVDFKLYKEKNDEMGIETMMVLVE